MDFSNVMFAFSLTLFAGLSTCVGSALSLLTQTTNRKFLSVSLGFSAGVMIYVSFVEIFAKARESLSYVYGEDKGYWFTVVGFFIGILCIGIIDKLLPQEGNIKEIKEIENIDKNKLENNEKLMRMGVFTALAIAIHNFPEGLATFTSALADKSLGIPIAIAIAIHNIPEGIAVAVPVYYATGNKKKAFTYSFLSGLSEPIGALVGYIILYNYFNEATYGLIFSFVAGMMVYISLDELLPAAKEYGEHHLSMLGFILGMALMALSLLLFV